MAILLLKKIIDNSNYSLIAMSAVKHWSKPEKL